MKDGLYRIVFTTTSGTLGEGASLVKDGVLVGADLLHSYRAVMSGSDDALTVEMRCRRHAPDIVSQLDLPLEFDLHWQGRETSYGFVAETRLPGSEFTLLATARRVDDAPV